MSTTPTLKRRTRRVANEAREDGIGVLPVHAVIGFASTPLEQCLAACGQTERVTDVVFEAPSSEFARPRVASGQGRHPKTATHWGAQGAGRQPDRVVRHQSPASLHHVTMRSESSS